MNAAASWHRTLISMQDATMRTHGIDVPFHDHPIEDLRQHEAAVAAKNPEFQYLVEILDSVLASPVRDDLAVTPRMHDLLFLPRPIPEPPYGVIWVRAPNSMLGRAKAGHVVIEEVSLTGHRDVIERPSSEAVRLFWRFIKEKYGIEGRGLAQERP